MQTVKSIWDFFQTELLGMSWLNRLIGDLLNACGLDTAGKVGGSVQFFIYDTIKIMVLLGVLILIISYIQSYFPPERTKKILGRFHGVGANCIAALLGTVTPFCSCSSIPLFIGFVKGGIPLGVTFAYLITSPLVNEVAVALFIGTFGLRITIIYVISGVLLGMVGGFILGKMKLEAYLSDWVKQIQQNSTSDSGIWEKEHTPFFRRLPVIMQEAWGIVRGVFLYILIGIGVGAFMHGYVPEGFFEQYMSKENWFAVPLSVILAVPMYANAAGIVPVIEVFVAKGIPIGTAIAFMMAMNVGHHI